MYVKNRGSVNKKYSFLNRMCSKIGGGGDKVAIFLTIGQLAAWGGEFRI
jgi:hypothetical protein